MKMNWNWKTETSYYLEAAIRFKTKTKNMFISDSYRKFNDLLLDKLKFGIKIQNQHLTLYFQNLEPFKKIENMEWVKITL